MKTLITCLICFITLVTNSQPKDNSTVEPNVYFNAVTNYLTYVKQVQTIAPDTLIIEQEDTINFNLPNIIDKTVIRVMPIGDIVTALMDKPNTQFYKLMFWADNKKTVRVIITPRSCIYPETGPQVIEEPKNYQVYYSKTKKGLWTFEKAENGGTGCTRHYQYMRGRLYLYESVCS